MSHSSPASPPCLDIIKYYRSCKFLVHLLVEILHCLISPHIMLPFLSCRNCIVDLHDRKRTLVPCIRCICVSNHIGMRRTGICLLPCQHLDDRVMDHAKALSQTHPGLMQSLHPIFLFISQPPPNISHLKRDVLEHHVNLGGDGATECIVAMHHHQYISQVSFCVLFHQTHSSSQQKRPVPQNKHLPKMQAQCVDIDVGQNGVGPLPLLHYT